MGRPTGTTENTSPLMFVAALFVNRLARHSMNSNSSCAARQAQQKDAKRASLSKYCELESGFFFNEQFFMA